MSAEANVIKKAQIAKVRELDFAQLFGENIQNLIRMLGVTRKIPVTAGTALKKLTVTGTLDSGIVAEGDVIPLSQYETQYTTVAEASLLKWRKATTAEAILKGGYDQSVIATNNKLILDVQKSIRTAFVNSLATGDGTASGTGLQAALADAWGKLQVLFEDDNVQAVYFLNPMDVAAYLATAQITVQTAFGMSYVENFLGLGTVIMTGAISQGTFYATAAENIVCYYINVNEANGLGDAFDFTTDAETGFIGVHEDGNYQRMQEETVAIAGITFFAERDDGVLVGTIGSEQLKDVTLSAVDGTSKLFEVNVSDMQENIAVNGNNVSGTLKYLSGSNAITDVWGEGNFFCFQLTADNWSAYDSVKVGVEPSQGSGLVEIINDPDKNGVVKIGNDVSQKFKIVASKAGKPTKVQVFDLSGLVLEDEAEG